MRSWSSVLWAIQTKLKQEDSTVHLVKAFQTFGLNWAAFPLLPGAGEVPVFPWDGTLIYYGSTKLIQLVQQDPAMRERAAFFYSPEMHSVSWYGPRFGKDYLNDDAQRMTIGDVLAMPDSTLDFFIRPEAGVKLFGGGVMDVPRVRQLVEQQPTLPGMVLDANTPVYVNDPVDIEAEYRTWFIGDKIAAIVGYKRLGRIDPWVVDPDSQEYQVIEEFALEQGSKIQEVEACVLDVAITPGNVMKVVEINCIHTSGFYLTEHISDVVCELTNYVRERT